MGSLLKGPYGNTKDVFEREFCGDIFELLVVTLKGVNGAAVLKMDMKYLPYILWHVLIWIQMSYSISRGVLNGW